jgi:drug/metabolite transporter (DMT)-like permease
MLFARLEQPGKIAKSLIGGLSIGAATMLVVIIRDIGVLGNLTGIFSLPAYTSLHLISIANILTRMEVLFSALFFRQKYGKADVLLVALAVLGISVFFVGSLPPGQLSGNLVGLRAGVFMAGMYLSVGKTAGEEKMSAILFGQLLTAVIGIPFFFFTKGTLTPISAVYLLILGVFQIGVPYILLALASKSCPPLACCLIAAVEPVLNPVWVLLFSGERPGLFSLLGGVIVIGAVTAQCILQDKRSRLKTAK